MSFNNSPVGPITTGLQSYEALDADLTPIPFSNAGIWTPNLQINSVDTGITYTTQLGNWLQVGNIVQVTVVIVLSSKGVQTGNVTISNFPVITGATGSINTIQITDFSGVTLTADYETMSVRFANASTVGTLFASGSAETAINVTDAMLSDTSAIRFTGAYFTI